MDNRIRPIKQNEFRTHLSLEDVYSGLGKLFPVFNSFGRYENVVVFADNPISCPLMNYMFYVKVDNVNDPMLLRAVKDLVYINPGIERQPHSIKKLSEYLYSSIVIREMVDSTEFFNFIPSLVTRAILEGEEIHTDRVVLFEKNTMLSSKEKILISKNSRQYRTQLLQGELIHNKALELVEVFDILQISPRTVHQEVKESPGLKTYRTFKNYVLDKTIKMLEDTNKFKFFKSEKELEQYKNFTLLKSIGTYSTRDIVKMIGISYSTAANFNKIDEELVNNGIHRLREIRENS